MKKNHQKFIAIASAIIPVAFLSIEGASVAMYNSFHNIKNQTSLSEVISSISSEDNENELTMKLANYEKIYTSNPEKLSFTTTDEQGQTHLHIIPVKTKSIADNDFPSVEEVKKRIDNMKNGQIFSRPKMG